MCGYDVCYDGDESFDHGKRSDKAKKIKDAYNKESIVGCVVNERELDCFHSSLSFFHTSHVQGRCNVA